MRNRGYSGRRRHGLDLRRGDARHPHPALGHFHPLRHRDRDVHRQALPRGRDAGAHAHGPLHGVDALHHLEARLPRPRGGLPLFVAGEIPVHPEDRPVHRHHRGGDVRALRRRGHALGGGGGRRGALRGDGGDHLPHVEAGPVVADPARHHAGVGDDPHDHRRLRPVRLHAHLALPHPDAGAGDRRHARQQMGADGPHQRVPAGVRSSSSRPRPSSS